MPSIPVYLSHSYRREDRDVNDHFWQVFNGEKFSFTVDPGSAHLSTTVVELMMARSVGFVAVVPFREEEDRYHCSPFIVYEYGLAVQTHQPRLVLRDKRVPPRYFRMPDTIEVEFDPGNLDRCTDELRAEIGKFRGLTSGRSARRPYRLGKVGIALPREGNGSDPDPGARRAVLEGHLDRNGDEVIDLTSLADDAMDLARAADGCDFVVVDLDDSEASRVADFLLGRGTPLLKVARRGPRIITPRRLLGCGALRRAAAADELVTYWSSAEELDSRIGHQMSLLTTDRTELADFDVGHRYFRSLGRQVKPVFVSNAGPANDLAKDLARGLQLENIPFFHYRFQNPIGLGKRWSGELDRMVTASKIFMPLIDDAYWDSEYCKREYELAARLAAVGQMTIVPAILGHREDRPEIPYQGADLRELPRSEQVQLLVRHLDELLAGDTGRSAGLTTAGPVEAGRISVDVAIITILEEEYAAVLRLLGRVRTVAGSAELDNQHAWVVGQVDAPQAQAPYTVALAMSSRAGTNAAVLATKNTMQAFDPHCVLVVGVAGGLGGVRLGDVVVADRICAYEYGKLDRDFHPRDDLDSPTDAALTSAARTLAARYPGWYAELAPPGEPPVLSPRIIVGHVASGDKIVDNPADEFFASVLRSRRELQAVEMEGAGAAAAIQDIREMQRAVSFGMIRGISDLPRADGTPAGWPPGRSAQTELRDSWKARAASAAAAAAIQLIRLSWPRPPRGGSAP